MKTVTLTYKHIDVNPITVSIETFREMTTSEIDLYSVSFNDVKPLEVETVKAIAMQSVKAVVKSVKVVGKSTFYRMQLENGLQFSAMIDSDFGAFEAACEIFSSMKFFTNKD